MGLKWAAVGVACGMIATAGSAVAIALGHRPWYAWTTVLAGIGSAWTVWSVRRSDAAAAVEQDRARTKSHQS